MACRVGFRVVFLGKHGNPKWNTKMGAPSTNSKCRDILKSILISSTDGFILIGFMYLTFVLSKQLISIGSFHLHDQQWCPWHHHLKGLSRGYSICLGSGRLRFALLSLPKPSVSVLCFRDTCMPQTYKFISLEHLERKNNISFHSPELLKASGNWWTFQ